MFQKKKKAMTFFSNGVVAKKMMTMRHCLPLWRWSLGEEEGDVTIAFFCGRSCTKKESNISYGCLLFTGVLQRRSYHRLLLRGVAKKKKVTTVAIAFF
jgi:hypothetical protein